MINIALSLTSKIELEGLEITKSGLNTYIFKMKDIFDDFQLFFQVAGQEPAEVNEITLIVKEK